jgi:hypothetical protein
MILARSLIGLASFFAVLSLLDWRTFVDSLALTRITGGEDNKICDVSPCFPPAHSCSCAASFPGSPNCSCTNRYSDPRCYFCLIHAETTCFLTQADCGLKTDCTGFCNMPNPGTCTQHSPPQSCGSVYNKCPLPPPPDP